MPDSSQKPNVLILGGLNTYSRALAALLVPVEGDALVSHLRIVDKYSVAPATTYLGSEFPKILEKPEVDYRQLNLAVAPAVTAAFEPSEGQPSFDYVFDYTGEVRPDRSDVIQIKTTFGVAHLIGLEAARRGTKAYVRIQPPFYETPSHPVNEEKEDIKPEGVNGTWWHETLRMLGAIPDLNLAILRVGFVYGPYVNIGNVCSALIVGSVYGFMKKPMKSMWSPGKNPTNTVHVVDVAGAALALARWLAPLGRKEADKLAGESIPFHNDKSKVKGMEDAVPYNQKVVAPLFNLVDDSKSTLLSVGQTVTSYFGTTFEFFNMLENAKLKLMDDSVEEINEVHVGGWTAMITNADPPIPNTPLSAYMDKYSLQKYVLALSNRKIKEIVGYQLKYPVFNHEVIQEIVEKWVAEGSWPNIKTA